MQNPTWVVQGGRNPYSLAESAGHQCKDHQYTIFYVDVFNPVIHYFPSQTVWNKKNNFRNYCGWTESYTTSKPVKPLCAGLYRGIESFQVLLSGAGFRPSTVLMLAASPTRRTQRLTSPCCPRCPAEGTAGRAACLGCV